MSLIETVKPKSIAAPCHPRQAYGPTGIVPREGFSPINPQNEAGILIEPPPSLAPAKGTIPAETAAAAPPLDPPGVHSRFRGFLLGHR